MGKKRIILQKKCTETKTKKDVKDYEFKSLNHSFVEKALLAAEAQIFKLNKDGKLQEPIILQLGTLVPTAKFKEYTRRMILLPNRLRKLKETTVLLVTKDPVDKFRSALDAEHSVTEGVFKDIIGYKKFKKMVGTSKSALKTSHEYDMIVLDTRLHSLLPKLLGPTVFCKSAQKYPLMVQMAKPDVDAELEKGKKSNKLKDNRVEPDYVLGQIRAWCRNTTFVPSSGPNISIVVGYPYMSGLEIVENIDAVITYLTDRKYRPIGGIINDGLKGITDLYLRADDKSVPIMKSTESL
ncbi:hypothetical protein CANINC_000023 [Pichia inconspicua]|uniref:Ribosomal protein L1 n=1 Tax=Pichia inconspicua TaxID=52247 RepID=A0A4T0X9T6_9ASCO|nr:hypothetical protein CANINC_000023 [[Candida] inconspicua]